MIISITIGNLLVLWAILGIVSISKKSNCMIKIYAFGMFSFLLISVGFLILGIIVQVHIKEYENDTDCTQKDIFKELYQLNQLSYQTLCQDSCQCNFQGSSYEADLRGIKNYQDNKGSAQKVQDCQDFNNFDLPNQQRYSDLLQMTEEILGCSGICNINSYFVFSDVNAGIPNQDCKKQLVDLVNKNNIDFIIGFSVITFILILNIILCLIILSKQKKGKVFQKSFDGLYFVNNQVVTI